MYKSIKDGANEMDRELLKRLSDLEGLSQNDLMQRLETIELKELMVKAERDLTTQNAARKKINNILTKLFFGDKLQQLKGHFKRWHPSEDLDTRFFNLNENIIELRRQIRLGMIDGSVQLNRGIPILDGNLRTNMNNAINEIAELKEIVKNLPAISNQNVDTNYNGYSTPRFFCCIPPIYAIANDIMQGVVSRITAPSVPSIQENNGENRDNRPSN
jgi:hypothetical protein